APDRPARHAPARAPGAREHPLAGPPPPRGRGRGRRGRRDRHRDQLRQVRRVGRQPRGRRAPLGARPLRHRPPGPARARARARLLDHVDYDADRLRLVTAILDTGARAYGPDFLPRINQAIEQMRGTPYRVVRDVYVLPSRDLAVMAAGCLEAHRGGAGLRAWL